MISYLLLLVASLTLTTYQTLAAPDLSNYESELEREELNTAAASYFATETLQTGYQEAPGDLAENNAAFSSIVVSMSQTDTGAQMSAWEAAAVLVSSNHKAEYTNVWNEVASLQRVPVTTAGPADSTATFAPSSADGTYRGPQLGAGPIVGIVSAAVLAVVLIAVVCCCPCCGCCVARRDEERGYPASTDTRSQYIDAISARQYKLKYHEPAAAGCNVLSRNEIPVADTVRSKPPSYSAAVSEYPV